MEFLFLWLMIAQAIPQPIGGRFLYQSEQPLISNVVTSGPGGGADNLLLVDGTSNLLLVDGTSVLLLE